jgi:hypothetical protein
MANHPSTSKLINGSVQAKMVTGGMVTVQEHECWLVAKLTSISVKDVVIKLIDLHINHDYVNFVTKLGNLSQDSITDQCVKPGESFDCIFKLEIGVMPQELMVGDLMSLMVSMGDSQRGQV